MEGRNGSRRPSWSWSYYEETGSTVSCSSGTVSTAYASSFSRPSSFSTEAMLFELGIHGDEDVPWNWEREETQQQQQQQQQREEEHMKSLVQEFFGAASADPSIKGGGTSVVVQRWLTELGVSWVLHVADGGGIKIEHPPHEAQQVWIRALSQFIKTIRTKASLFPDRGNGMPSIREDEMKQAAAEAQSCLPDQFQFARFVQDTMSKMLDFVDFIIVAVPPLGPSLDEVTALHQKMNTLLCVRRALSEALSHIRFPSHSAPSSPQVRRVQGEMVGLLSAKADKASKAVWHTMEDIWDRIMEDDGEDSTSTWTPTDQTPLHGSSSDIHKLTRSVTGHIKYLWENYWSLKPVVFQAACLGKYAAEIGNTTNPLASLTIQMMLCLEKKLGKLSQSFPDQGLRYLFLINNSRYIWQQLLDHTTNGSNFLSSYFTTLGRTMKNHMEAYLQLSWAPVLSCLVNPTPHCFVKNYSPLSKFEHEFHKTYTSQKLWKVPDPEQRKTLRKAITTKIIPGYTRYIEDNDVSTPKLTPQILEEMLQELFEG